MIHTSLTHLSGLRETWQASIVGRDRIKTFFRCAASFCMLLLCCPLARAQQDGAAQHPYTAVFRFVKGNDMFYVPWNGNGARLDSLCRALDPQTLEAGSVRVDGYGDDKAVVKIRSNRVKSELILRAGLTEDHFLTTNRTGSFNGLSNIVVVTLPSPKEAEKPAPEPEKEEQAVPAEESRPEEVQPQQPDIPAEEPQEALPSETAVPHRAYSLALRANLLRWATLTPDLGLEWRISRSWSVLVEGSWTAWSWQDKDRTYALWEVSPEVRYHIGESKNGYVGAMYKAGSFNYKFGSTGKQGDIMGGGLTGGYRLKLNDALSLDFSLGLGYLRADYEKYTLIDGVPVRRGNESKGWWGPVQAGATLVWNIF